MNVQMELWQLITLLIAFFACIGGFGKVLMGQFEKRLAVQFEAQETARAAGAKALRETIERYNAQVGQTAEQVKKLERDFLDWKADLPLNYVRREDYIRGQSVLEAKQDALYSETRLVQAHLEGLKGQLKGTTNG
jgi:hypothetical protein